MTIVTSMMNYKLYLLLCYNRKRSVVSIKPENLQSNDCKVVTFGYLPKHDCKVVTFGHLPKQSNDCKVVTFGHLPKQSNDCKVVTFGRLPIEIIKIICTYLDNFIEQKEPTASQQIGNIIGEYNNFLIGTYTVSSNSDPFWHSFNLIGFDKKSEKNHTFAKNLFSASCGDYCDPVVLSGNKIFIVCNLKDDYNGCDEYGVEVIEIKRNLDRLDVISKNITR